MPEYILPEMNEPAFQNLPRMVQGYIQAMFFTNTNSFSMVEIHDPENQEAIREGQADGPLPLDAGFLDLHPNSLADIIADCGAFHVKAHDLLYAAYDRPGYDQERAGMDFFYTRCGHGVGFWDRSELDDEGLGDALSEIAESFGNVDPWFSEEPDESSPTGYGYVYHSM